MGATKTIVEVDNFCYGQDADTIIENILQSRGIQDTYAFMNPDELFIEPPETIPFMDQACKIVKDALDNNKRIFLNVDSDTDGVTSGTIVKRYLEHCWDTEVHWHISKGKTHGASDELTAKLIADNPDVLIVVDSLDSTLWNYKKYKEMGIEVVVLDHHDINPKIPYDSVITLASSNRSSNKQLSGAGVCWKFCKRLDRMTGNDFADELSDLAAAGIVADMMDLSEKTMENRAIVNLGLRHLNNPAMKKIIGGFPYNSQSVSYSIAPLINACCRYNKNETAFKAFISDNTEEIKREIKIMKNCRDVQRNEVDSILENLRSQLQDQDHESVLVGMIETVNGINGLIANKIAHETNKPTLILKTSFDNDGNPIYSGSGRSTDERNFRKICEESGLGRAYGHPNAFGVFVNEDDLEAFITAIREEYQKEESLQCLSVDAMIAPEDITLDLIDKVKELNAISGTGFPQIQFVVKICDWIADTMTQGKHLVLKDGIFTYIQWNTGSQVEHYDDLSLEDAPLTVVGTLDSGFFGRRFVPRLIINQIVED